MYCGGPIIKNFKEPLSFFDELLQKNNLPTQKIWISGWQQVVTNLKDPVGRHKTSPNGQVVLLANDTTGVERQVYLWLQETQAEESIQRYYTNLANESHKVFYVITVYKDKTVCGLLIDWFGGSIEDNSKDFRMWPDQKHVFSCNELFLPEEVTVETTDKKEWLQRRQQIPLLLSNLDYLPNF